MGAGLLGRVERDVEATLPHGAHVVEGKGTGLFQGAAELFAFHCLAPGLVDLAFMGLVGKESGLAAALVVAQLVVGAGYTFFEAGRMQELFDRQEVDG